jgi:hypothetical protein
LFESIDFSRVLLAVIVLLKSAFAPNDLAHGMYLLPHWPKHSEEITHPIGS